MTFLQLAARTMAAALFVVGSQMPVQAQSVEEILGRKPVQAGVNITTPTETTGCKAEQLQWPKQPSGPTPSGFVLKDAQGRTLRQFVDTTGKGHTNIWSYFLNGTECYREVDINGNGKPDQYRWFGANGARVGIDSDEDGNIDFWPILSAEEASQELLSALRDKNEKRLTALLVTQADLQSIGLPVGESDKIMARVNGAVKRFKTCAETMQLTGKEKWIHLESMTPYSIPADSFGGREDLVRQRGAAVLYDKGDGKPAEMFQTGELVLIGRAWKLIDGPVAGAPQFGGELASEASVVPDAIREEINELAKAKGPMDRAPILEKIVAKTQGEQQQTWLKQVVDAYASAAETGDAGAMQRLKQWVESIEKSAAKSSAASYAAFRLVSAEYAVQIAKPGLSQSDIAKVQTSWREALDGFVKKNPTSEEAPDALMRLAVAHEFGGKDGETTAKGVYEQLATNFPNHPYASKAQGAVRRLTSEGQAFVLDAKSTIDGKPFSVNDLKGKACVVFYYANWGKDASQELKQLAELATAYSSKGFEIVTISLDDDAARATQTINAAQVPGRHLHAAGGLDRSPYAIAYGIQMVPHLFLVNKDGKIVNRNAQVGPTLKDEVEKLVK